MARPETVAFFAWLEREGYMRSRPDELTGEPRYFDTDKLHNACLDARGDPRVRDELDVIMIACIEIAEKYAPTKPRYFAELLFASLTAP